MYPNLPCERVVVDGVDISDRFSLALLKGTTLSPPEPKTYTIDIPGGNGVIDLTSALTGDVAFNDRTQEFTFIGVNHDSWEATKTKVMNFLHGRSLDYSLSWDPGYTYHGRFSVSSFEETDLHRHEVGTIVISVTADPYKSKGTQAYKLNATGGKLYRFESGRRKVHPVIECDQVCFFTLLPDGDEITVPAGTYRLNDVLFEQGMNECWINTQKFYDVTWQLLGEGDTLQKTWGELADTRWDEVHLLSQDSETVQRSWDDISLKTWESMGEKGSNPKHWYELNWTKNIAEDSTAYLTYEWEDL
jgi:hypothetical protein